VVVQLEVGETMNTSMTTATATTATTTTTTTTTSNNNNKVMCDIIAFIKVMM
jgi:hypothetical protein